MNTKLIVLAAFLLSSTTAFANSTEAKAPEHQEATHQAAEAHGEAKAEDHAAAAEHEKPAAEAAHEAPVHH